MHSQNKSLKHILNWGSKTLLTFALVLVVFSPLGQAFQVPVAQAVLAPSQPPPGSTLTLQQAYNNCISGPGGSAASCSQQTGYTPPATGDGSCSTFSECIATVVYVFTVGLGSLLAYIAGYFFNLAVYISLNSTAYALTFLTQGWSSVRDIANMGFIFILIYIAVTVIISAETNKTMEMLVKVVAIALVINFSFFFTRVVIDGGNILAVNFYNNTTQSTLADSLKKSGGTLKTTGTAANLVASAGTTVSTVSLNNVTLTGATEKAKDLTAGIMDAIQVQTILNDKSFKAFSQNSDFFTVLITLSFVYISVGVIFGLLAAMFFTIGIKFITRVVVLWLVIIAAPLALLMYAIPNAKAKGYFNEWLKALIVYSLYPAIFLFLYTLIIIFTQGLAGSSGSLVGNIFADINQTTSTGLSFMLGVIATISIKLGFVMVLLYLTMQASNTVSKWGGSMAQNITARPDAWLRSGIFGGAGGVGRYSLGWAGRNVGQSTFARNLAAKPGFGGLLGSSLVRGGRALGSSSFDARNSAALKANFGKEATGKGGYEASFNARATKKEDFTKLLKPTREQMEKAETEVLKNLAPEISGKLAQAVADYADARGRAERGELDPKDLKRARQEYGKAIKELGIQKQLSDARGEVGSGNAGKFADTLMTRSARNLFGLTSSGIPGMLSKTDQEAAARIRNPKGNDVERLKDILGRSGLKATSKFEESLEETKSSGGGGSNSGTRAPLTREAFERISASGLDKQSKALVEAITTAAKNSIPAGTPLNAEAIAGNKEFIKEFRKLGTTIKTVAKESAKKSSEDLKNIGNKLENIKTPPPSNDNTPSS